MTRISTKIVSTALVSGALALSGAASAKTVKITVAAGPPPLVTFVGAFKDIVTKKIDSPRFSRPSRKALRARA